MYTSQSNLNVPSGAASGADGSRTGFRATAATSNIGNWASDQPAFGQSQYEPGYLLSATMSSGGPSYPAPPLIPDPVSGKRPASMHAKFGTEPFAQTFRQSSVPPRGQSIIPDDENAPPSNSLLEGLNASETKKAYRHSVAGGFHSHTPTSPAPQSSNTISTPASATASTASASVIVFGFPPYLYHDIVHHFTSIGDTVSVDPPPSLDAGRNWITIVYKNPWEAARALRRNGEILTIGKEECMIGVKWADSNNSISETREFAGSPAAETATPSRPSIPSSTIGRPVTFAPSRSAYKQHHPGAAAAAAAGGTNEWGVALRNQSAASGTASASTNQGANGGIWNKMSDLVFGW